MRVLSARWLGALLIACLALPAPAEPSQRDRAREGQEPTLQERVLQLQASQQEILARLAQLRRELNDALEPLRVRAADQGEELRSLQARVLALEERLGLLAERLEGLGREGPAGSPAAASPRPVGSPMPPPERPAGLPGPAAADPSPAEPAAQPEADKLYSAAFTDYLRGDYDLAREGFGEFLRLHPDSPHADDAQYWIGESLYAKEDYWAARSAFREIPVRFPRSEKIPDALYKSAQCLLRLDDPQGAIQEMLELIEEHPASDAVGIACMHLERLGVAPPANCPNT